MAGPVLEIKTCEITFSFPSTAKILVRKGEWIDKEGTLAQNEAIFEEFNLTKILKTSPKNISRYLLIVPGAKVKEGEILAQKKTLLGKIIFKSPVVGMVEEVLPEGFLKIRTGEAKEIRSPIKALVKEIKETGEVTLEFKAAVFVGEYGIGGENWGKIEILAKDEVGLSDLPAVAEEKIFLTRGKVNSGFLHKAEALGAAGVLGGFFTEEVRVSEMVVVMAHAKEGLISETVWGTLEKYDQKTAFISAKEKCLKVPLE